MKLLFAVEVEIEVPDQAVARALQVDEALMEEDILAGGLDALAIGEFGKLELVRGNEADGMLGKVVRYTTGEGVQRIP